MEPKIIHLLESYQQSYTLVYGVAIGVVIAQLVNWLSFRTRRLRSRKFRNRETGTKKFTLVRGGVRPENIAPVGPRPLDAADQLRIVMNSEFSVQPLLNRKETRVFREVEKVLSEKDPGWQVMAQVSLGEILSSKNSQAYSCINAKRVDLLLVDDNCRPKHVIEYQGSGHHQGTAAARDAVKKEALRRAGLGYHEVVAGDTTPADLRRLIERLLGGSSAEKPEPDGGPPSVSPVARPGGQPDR